MSTHHAHHAHHLRRPAMRREHFEQTALWIASRQEADGLLPWARDGKMDPWDHAHAAMGLAASGCHEAAQQALRWLARHQERDGGWPMELRGREIVESTRQTNHAAYIATAAWYLQTAEPDILFLAEIWPVVKRAIDFVVAHQLPCGGIAWAVTADGRPWQAPLVTGSSSVHGSLVCAIRIAERLGRPQPAWVVARERLADLLCNDIGRFDKVDLAEPVGRHSMDWYYPILGGALRGAAARARLQAPEHVDLYVEEGVGCRCVADQPWYTVAETCELVLALDAAGLESRARQVFSWVHPLRTPEGGYWTGVTHPARELYPEGEQTPWTAATVMLAADVLEGRSPTANFFRELAGDEFVRESAVVDVVEVAAPAEA